MTETDHSLAAAYALNALDPAERAAFEEHLATCEACAIDVREMTATTTRLALAEPAEPPPHLREHVLDLASQTPQQPNDATVVPLRRRSSTPAASRWMAGIAAAALVVAAGLGVTTYQANQRADELEQSASQVLAIVTDPASVRTTMDVTGGGTGTLIVSRTSQQAVLATAGVPAVGADETYQLWAINDQGAKSLGLYDVNAAGDGTDLIDFPDSATTFGMTIEPGSGSAQPTTEPVLLIPVTA